MRSWKAWACEISAGQAVPASVGHVHPQGHGGVHQHPKGQQKAACQDVLVVSLVLMSCQLPLLSYGLRLQTLMAGRLVALVAYSTNQYIDCGHKCCSRGSGVGWWSTCTGAPRPVPRPHIQQHMGSTCVCCPCILMYSVFHSF